MERDTSSVDMKVLFSLNDWISLTYQTSISILTAPKFAHSYFDYFTFSSTIENRSLANEPPSLTKKRPRPPPPACCIFGSLQ